jgi:integrase
LVCGRPPERGLFLRLGDLCSLRWPDIDFKHGEVLVGSGVVYVPCDPLIDKDAKAHDTWRVAVGPVDARAAAGTPRPSGQHRGPVRHHAARDAYVFSHEPDASKPIRPDGSATGSLGCGESSV